MHSVELLAMTASAGRRAECGEGEGECDHRLLWRSVTVVCYGRSEDARSE
jgi:hypothetical protein